MYTERTLADRRAMARRPTVTAAQNTASPSLAEVAGTPLPTNWVVPQFPNMVSPIPYTTKAAAKSQNRSGMSARDPVFWPAEEAGATGATGLAGAAGPGRAIG